MLRWPTLGLLAVALPAASLALAYASPAFACGSTPCSEVKDSQPNDADDPVPLNTELRVLYFGSIRGDEGGPCDLQLTHLRLVPRNGTAVDLEGTLLKDPSRQQVWVVAKPTEPLLPDTGYTLQVDQGLTMGTCSCGQDSWATLSTFTTGVVTNDDRPQFSGLNRLSAGAPSEGFIGGCTETNFVPITLELGTPPARSGLRYNIYVDGVIQQRYVPASSPGAAAQIETECTLASGSGALLSGGSQVEVRAVDLAGNESAAHAPLAVSATCQAASAASPFPDASSSTETRTAAAGCALAPRIGSRTPGGLAALPLALLGVVRRRAVRSGPRCAARRA